MDMAKLVLTFVLSFHLLSTQVSAETFRAGAATVDITPQQLPVSMIGSFQDRLALRVHDPLHSRALVLDDGDSRVAFVVCDLCLVSREIFDAAKVDASARTGIPVDRILMAATHTHTAPTVVPMAQSNPSPAYLDTLPTRIADSVVRANENLVAARLGWASAEEPDEVSNRRWHVRPEAISPNPLGGTNDKVRTNAPRGSDILIKPAGPIDPEVIFFSVTDGKGSPLSIFANYSLHYVGGIPPFELSADYFGEFDRQLKTRLDAGESFVGILSNGASGDINNYNFVKPRPRPQPMERINAVAGKIVDHVSKANQSITHQDDVKLAMAESILRLGVRKPDAAEVKRARETLAKAAQPKKLNMVEVYAQETVRIADYPDTVELKLQVLRIGEDLAVVAIPCEVFAEIGLEIKEKSPAKGTIVVCLANGYNGYLPSPEQHQLGGYETWRSGWSYLEEEASNKITNAVLGSLEAIWKK